MSAFLDSTQRWQLMGHISSRLSEFVDEVTAHEVSHQWWGHEVDGPATTTSGCRKDSRSSPRGLFLQFTGKDQAKYLAYWQHARESLTEKNGFGKRTNDAGPLWLGLRLNRSREERRCL